MSNDKYGFIILGAGESSRMGTPKGLLDFNGKTLLERHLDNIRSINNIADIILVVSDKTIIYYRKITTDSKISYIINTEAHNGMFSSILSGIVNYNTHTCNGVFIGNIDCSIENRTIKHILEYIQQNPDNERPKTIIPHYNNIKGHPIFLNNPAVSIIKNENNDNRMDHWVKNNTEIVKLDVNYKSVTMNLNTPEDYETWINMLYR